MSDIRQGAIIIEPASKTIGKIGAMDANNMNEEMTVQTKEKDTKESTHAPKSSQELGNGSLKPSPQASLLLELNKPAGKH